MHNIHTIAELRATLANIRPKTVALVPTMGNLHDGHLSLVKIAKQHADVVWVSIFVNPTQFGVGEDFDSYPRTLSEDCQKLQGLADGVFAPDIHEMYPTYPPNIHLTLGDISQILCAKTRPTHFDGVGLVVGKLFNIVRPDVAVFGKKDYQQLALVRRLNDEFNFGVRIIGGDIVRAPDGLALSSRNQYLSPSERQTAPFLQKTLRHIADTLSSAPFEAFATIIQNGKDTLNQNGFVVDYLQVYTQNLQPPSANDTHFVLLAAAFLGKARLLDNVEFVR